MKYTEVEGTPQEIKEFLEGKKTPQLIKEHDVQKFTCKTLFDGVEDCEPSVDEPTINEPKEPVKPKERIYRKEVWYNSDAQCSYKHRYVRIIKNKAGTKIYALRQHKSLLERNGITTREINKLNHNLVANIRSSNIAKWLISKKFKEGDRLDMDINKFIDEVKAL